MAWNSSQQRTNNTSFGRTPMSRHIILICLFLVVINFLNTCKNKQPNYNKSNDSLELIRNSIINSQSTLSKDSLIKNTSDISLGKPLDFKILSSIFPPKIDFFNLHKINKGLLNISGKTIQIVSGEYVGHSGSIVVSCYDYLVFSLLPDHLKNLFDPYLTKNNPDIFYIGKDIVGSFYMDNLTNVRSCNLVYNRRFHIRIEAYNTTLLNEDLIKIATSLILSKLDDKQGNSNE